MKPRTISIAPNQPAHAPATGHESPSAGVDSISFEYLQSALVQDGPTYRVIVNREKVQSVKSVLVPEPSGSYVYIRGGYVQVRHPLYGPREGNPVRGKPGPLSRGARKRLLILMNVMDWQSVGKSSFVTLTYPDDVPCLKASERALHRQHWFRRLERHLKRHVACIWRVEWMPRLTGERKGTLMPHYHLCLLGVSGLGKSWVKGNWGKTLGYARKDLQVDVRDITGQDGCIKYVAKYTSKAVSLDICAYHTTGVEFGRSWGVTRKKLVPFRPVEVNRRMTQQEIDVFANTADFIGLTQSAELQQGFYVLGDDNAKFWKSLLDFD